MTLPVEEFIRRFLLHTGVLHESFVGENLYPHFYLHPNFGLS